MKSYSYKTSGTCAAEICFDIDEGDIVKNVRFVKGCNGNTQGISRLVEGMKADEVISRLKGTNCNGKGTSCPDQLALALEAAREERL
ncbi:MAG: TIGR03905 family TSCPD domain-containing protein [Oscillospiraceae bacterium]|nr:TIGR03905 family TSCPD domain-containing protein [Oscillospiraceae bacterium]